MIRIREEYERGFKWLKLRMNIILYVIEINDRILSIKILLYYFIIKGFFLIYGNVMVEFGNYLGGN